MKAIPKKHLEFIQQVISGVSQQEAYRVSVGKKGIRSNVCDVKGSQLAKKYALQIAEAKQKAQDIVTAASDSKAAQIALSKIVQQAEADAKAFRILSDDDMVDDLLVVGSKYSPIKRKPTQKEIQDAYKAYNLRFGSNAPAKTDITSGGKEITGFNYIVPKKD